MYQKLGLVPQLLKNGAHPTLNFLKIGATLHHIPNLLKKLT